MRFRYFVAVVLGVLLLAPVTHADVKTRQKGLVKFEGMLGRMANLFGGSAAKDGVVTTVAVKGARKASLSDLTGQIIDLSEEKVYDLDIRKKEYRVTTFAELREKMKKAQADAEKAAKDMPVEERDQLEQSGKEVEITVDVKETGEKKTIAGFPARQVIVTVTAHEKGKALDESGGMVLSNDVWVGPRVAALDEVAQFDLRFFKAVYGGDMIAAAQNLASAMALYPRLQELMTQMETRTRALEGTTLLIVMTAETVKSAEAMKQASAPAAGGGGLGGALARRVARRDAPKPRSLLLTSSTETLSIDTSASDADVAIPAGFKERK